MTWWQRLLFCCVLLPLAACTRLDPPQQMRELVVAIRQTPVFYQHDGDADSGFELDLLEAFATRHSLKLRLVPAADIQELQDLLAAGRVHMAASVPLDGKAPLAVSIRSVGHLIVGNEGSLVPDSLEELTGHTVDVAAGSPAARQLRALPATQQPIVLEHPRISENALLARVAERKAELAATDELHLSLAETYYPDLRAAVSLPGRTDFGWLFGGDYGADLRDKAQAYITDIRRDGSLARIQDRYFGHIKRLNSIGVADFIEDIHTLLPKFRYDFQRAQDVTGIDWRLIAAVAYQESKWDPLATSPTGVRGIMMLTEDTADHLGVKNRLDPKESIRAGSRYIVELMDQMPPEAKFPDRIWLALAAYNLGMGHMNGARAIAKGQKRDPNVWYEMKQVLPLLARPSIYARLKSGRARGGEAVIMVENIRTYYDILSRFEPAYSSGYGGSGLKPLTLR